MELSAADLTYVVAGGALILALIVPTLVSRVAVSSPIVLVAMGVLLGLTPLADSMEVDLVADRSVIEHITEFAVLVALLGVGLALDRPLRLWDRDSRRTWSPTWRLLLIAMPLTIAGVTALGVATGLSLTLALLLGAALAPTDPVLASDVQVAGPSVQDEGDTLDDDDAHVQERSEIRFALTSEAGLNDGLAFPFVYAAILVGAGGALWPSLGEWVGFYVVVRVAVGLLVGFLVGTALARVAFRSRAESLRLAERGDPLLALAALLTAYGLAEIAQGYGFLAVFACGMAIRAAERGSSYHRGMHELTERLELLMTLLILLFLGIAVGQGLLGALTLGGALIGLGLLFVIRPVAAYLSLAIRAPRAELVGGLRPGERAVVSFFGIRGISTVFYLAYAAGDLDVPESVWATAAFTIITSVVVHGVLATPVMRWVEEHAEGSETDVSGASDSTR